MKSTTRLAAGLSRQTSHASGMEAASAPRDLCRARAGPFAILSTSTCLLARSDERMRPIGRSEKQDTFVGQVRTKDYVLLRGNLRDLFSQQSLLH